MGQFSMVNLELFNIVEDIKKVSKAFVVHPKNVNADNASSTNLPISSLLSVYFSPIFLTFNYTHTLLLQILNH